MIRTHIRYGIAALGAAILAASVAAEQDRAGIPIARERAKATNAAGQPVRAYDDTLRNYGRDDLQSVPPSAQRAPASRAVAQAKPTAAPTNVHADWGFAALGSGIGLSGIVSAKNGRHVEIYLGGSGQTFGGNNVWHALRYLPATQDFHQVFVSEHFEQGIRRITLVRITAALAPRIVIALADGTVHLYDQRSKRRVWSFQDPCATRGGLQDLATADLNRDGRDEYISSCADQTLIAYGSDYTAWSLDGAGGNEIVVGQMDNDRALEIATTSGQVIDTRTQSRQWQLPLASVARLRAADVDRDGRDEIVATEGWYSVSAYDVDQQRQKWSIPTNLDVAALLVTDVDRDGVQELLIGDGQWGMVHAYSTKTQQQEWAIPNPEHGVTAIVVADLNGDGTKEVLWGAGATSTGPDHLYVADWRTQAILWQNEHLDGPFVGPQIGDLDGDTIPEIVVASYASDSGYQSGRIVVIDSRTLRVRALSAGVAGGWAAWTGVHDLKLRDLNGDGRLEIVVATDWLYDGLIEAYAFSAANEFTLVWSNLTRPIGAPFYSVDVADVDGDGSLEVVGGSGVAHSGAEGVFIYAYDAATGAERWRTQDLGGYWSGVADLAITDTDGDGAIEIGGMLTGWGVYVFGGATHGLEATIDIPATALTTLRQGGSVQLLIGDSNGRTSLRAFDGTAYPEVSGMQLAFVALDGVHVGGGDALWVGSGGTLTRFLSGSATFQSANYGSGFGRDIGLLYDKGWVFSAGGYGVHGFATQP